MYSFNPKFWYALGVLLLSCSGVLGMPASTTTTTSYTVGTWDATISPSPTSSSTCLSGYSSSTTCSRSICVDNVNECGQMYGGCFLDPVCTGGTAWPTFSKPPCPSQTCTRSICADYINECGLSYGGCFLDPKCTGGTAWPTFSKPPCPTYTAAVLSISSSASGHSTTCTRTICVDKVSPCGQKYGGCALDPKCTGGTGLPTFTPPPCPSSTSITSDPYPTPTPSASATCTRTICADYINECGMRYGGCFLDPKCTGGTGLPATLTKPICPSTVTSQPTATTTVIPAVLMVTNDTSPNATVQTTPSVPLYTGAAARNFAGFGVAAMVVAAGVLFL